MLASWKGSLPATTLLLQYYNKHHDKSALLDFVRAIDDFGRTALHFATEQGHSSFIWPLLQAGSDVMQRALKGQTALDMCGEEPSGRACAELLRLAMEEVERVKLLTKARAVSDKAHRVASSLRLAHLLRRAEKVEDHKEEEKKEEKGLSRRMRAFLSNEKASEVNMHKKEERIPRQLQQQGEAQKAEEGDVKEMDGRKKSEDFSRRMIAFILNEKTPHVKVRGGEGGMSQEHHRKGKESGEKGKKEEEEKVAKTDMQRAGLAYVLGERMPENEGRLLNEELCIELVSFMTPPWVAD